MRFIRGERLRVLLVAGLSGKLPRDDGSCESKRDLWARTPRARRPETLGFLHHADAPGRLSLSYDVIELLRPRVDECVFRFLKSRPFDRKEFAETGSQVLLAPKTAREVVLRVLAEVPPSECEEAARRVADCILVEV